MYAAYIVDYAPTDSLNVIYDGDVDPTDEYWILNGTDWATADADTGILTIDEAHTVETSFQKPLQAHASGGTLVMIARVKTNASTVGGKGKIHSTSLGVGCRFEIAAGGGSVVFYKNGGSDIETIDTTADYVWIKMRLTASRFDAWVNDTQTVTNQTPYVTAENLIFFGKESTSSGGYQYWDYVNVTYTPNYRDGFNKIGQSACTLSCSAVNSSWPLSYLYNGRATKGTIFSDNENIELNIDFGSSEECKCIMIVGHNFTPGARVKIENDDNSSQSSPDLEHYVDWNKDKITILLDSNYTNRYWRITIDDPDNADNVYIGELIMGNYIEFNQNFNWGVKYSKDYNNINHDTDFGQQWSYFLNSLDELSGINFDKIEDQTALQLLDMFEDCRGSHRPLAFIWTDEDPELQHTIFGHLTDEYGRNLNFIDVNKVAGFKVIGLPMPKTMEDEA